MVKKPTITTTTKKKNKHRERKLRKGKHIMICPALASFNVFQWRIIGALSFLSRATKAHSLSHRLFSNKAVNLFSSAFPFKIITTELQGEAPPTSTEKKPLESSLRHINIFTSHWHSQNIIQGKQITLAIFRARETNINSLQKTNGCQKHPAVTRNMCDRCFEKQCGLLDGAVDQQPSKLYVTWPVPMQVAQFVPVISLTFAFLHLPEALQHVQGPSPCKCRGSLFHCCHPSQMGYKSGSLLEVNKQNTLQMVENHSCEQFIDLLNSTTIYSNWLLIY